MNASTSRIAAALGVGAALLAGVVQAGGTEPSETKALCHNIGGPRDLGANCEATGTCTFILQDGSRVVLASDQFLGILVGAKGTRAILAHLAHGDGFATGPIYDPPLHLASVVGAHQASNVDCLASRVFAQPDEPGN
jgi:hypothetical protein